MIRILTTFSFLNDFIFWYANINPEEMTTERKGNKANGPNGFLLPIIAINTSGVKIDSKRFLSFIFLESVYKPITKKGKSI